MDISLIIKNLQILESQGARFCRVLWREKIAYESDWPNKPYKLNQINLKKQGLGINLGHGNLFALDIDNEKGRDRFFEYFGVMPCDYPSVSWSSGKNFDKQFQPEISTNSNIEVLFLLSDSQAALLGGRKTFEKNTLDLRWHGSQSVLPSLSPHPDTGKPYIWHHAPSEYAIAAMPTGILERMIADLSPHTPLPEPALDFSAVPPAPQPKMTAATLTEDPPLTFFLAREHRDWIEQGAPEGSRNNSAFRLASDLIGTEAALSNLGIYHKERARDLFDWFCDRCSPPIASKERETIWRSANKKTPKSCLDDEMLTNCLKGWQIRNSRENNLPRKTSKPPQFFDEADETEENRKEPDKIDSRWADDIAQAYLNRLAWDESIKEWRFYESGKWKVISSLKVGGIIKNYMLGEGKGCTNGKLTSVESILKINLFCDEWDSNSDLIPFADGCYSISENKLRPHSPKYYFTWQLPHKYASADSNWQKINEWLSFATGGNDRDKNILIAFAAATLKGKSELHKFLHLQGIGGSGKSTYIRLLEDLIGEDNHYSSSLVEWNNTRFESANGFGKRLISFPDENSKIANVESLKKLTGGDSIRYEEKGKKATNYKFTGMVIIASNASPFVGASSSAIARRQIEVMFNALVPNGQRRNLNREFQPELPAFSRYLLELSDEWIMNILNDSQGFGSITAASWDNQCQNDSIAAWIDEQIIFESTASAPVGSKKADADKNYAECLTLYESYTLFCSHNNYMPKSLRRFSADLCELGTVLGKQILKTHTREGKKLSGLRLRVEKIDADIPT